MQMRSKEPPRPSSSLIVHTPTSLHNGTRQLTPSAYPIYVDKRISSAFPLGTTGHPTHAWSCWLRLAKPTAHSRLSTLDSARWLRFAECSLVPPRVPARVGFVSQVRTCASCLTSALIGF